MDKVHAHRTYVRLVKEVRSANRSTEDLEREALSFMESKPETPDDELPLPAWLENRARTIATVAEMSEPDVMFENMVRQYVIVEQLHWLGVTRKGLKAKWKAMQPSRQQSKAWLVRATEEQSMASIARRKEFQEHLVPSRDRKAIPPSSFYATPRHAQPGFAQCGRRGCLNHTGDFADDGKLHKTRFVVENERSGDQLQVCRTCITVANSLQESPMQSNHLRKKHQQTVKLSSDVYLAYSEMASSDDRPASGGGASGASTDRKRWGNESPRKNTTLLGVESAKRVAQGKVGKRKKKGDEVGDDHGGPSSDNMISNGICKKQQGTDADPILLSSSDDEDNVPNKRLMAVINPCQRQTRRTTKLEVETDPVLDKLKCFMPPEGGRGSIKLSLRDYLQLRPMEFLNDSCIDYFMKSIEIRLKEEIPKAWERCYFFNSFFYKKLTDNQSDFISEETKALAGMPLGEMDEVSLQALRCYDLTKNWTKHVDLFEKDYLFIPICEHLHWSLLIVCHPGCGIIKDMPQHKQDPNVVGTFMIHLDSLRSHKSFEMGKLVKMYLQNEWKAKLRQGGNSAAKRWQAAHPGETRDFLKMNVRRPHVPRQDNHFDCGLFLCVYVEQFLAYLPKSMNPDKVPTKIGRGIFKAKQMANNRRYFPRRPMFLTERWFPTNEVGNLRTDLATKVLRAMAVNAGVMDHLAKWKTDNLSEEQRHMLTYLMNQLDMLACRNEPYNGPEWLEVQSDEEEYGEIEVEFEVGLSTDDAEANAEKKDERNTRNDIKSCSEVGINVERIKSRRGTPFPELDDLIVDDPIENLSEDPSGHEGAGKTPKEAIQLSRSILSRKKDRNTPDIQATTQKHRDGSIEIIDRDFQQFRRRKKKNMFAVPGGQVSTISQRAGSGVQKSRGANLVKNINAKKNP